MKKSVSYAFIFSSALLVVSTFNNCSKVSFSSLAPNSTQGIPPGGGPNPQPSNIVQLSPYINAVAFEDLYYVPGTTPSENPDFDYNDFMTEFKIQELSNAQNQLTDIYIDFYPRAVGAGYDHIFYLILNGTKTTPSNNSANLPVTKPMFNGSAEVTLQYFDQNGSSLGAPTSTPYNQDVEIYSSTHGIFGMQSGSGQLNTILPSGYVAGTIPSNYIVSQQNARVHITLDTPALNPAPASGTIDPTTFRVILHPKQTDLDIDIINVDPTNFVGTTGNPWGFIIPTDWQWMVESNLIDNGYPEFVQYRNALINQPATGDYQNWFINAAGTTTSGLYPYIPWKETMPAVH